MRPGSVREGAWSERRGRGEGEVGEDEVRVGVERFAKSGRVQVEADRVSSSALQDTLAPVPLSPRPS